jgi:sulfur carrier protein ThiS adenylyltransferase
MNNIDEWLNSLGFDEEPQPATENFPSTEPITEPTESSTQELSENDFDDILSDLGFSEVQEAEIVEDDEDEDEEGEEEEVENTEELIEFNPESARGLTVHLDDSLLEEGREFRTSINGEPVQHLNLVRVEEIPSGTESVESVAVPQQPQESPLIQPNSPTLLMNDATSRFSGTEWYNEIQRKRIIIAGMGGIGSWLAFQIARMHPDAITLYDDDEVERANMSGQLFAHTDVGEFKVNAVANKIYNFTTTEHVMAVPEKFTPDCEASDIMMCGFDNMEARGIFYRQWLVHVDSKPEEEKKKCLFLDGRLSIDTLQIFCITGDDTANMARYSNNYLFSDDEADETVCSMKQTTYLACMIGSLMTNLFTNFVANLLNPVIPYDLPFFTEYDAQNMIFKTEY